MLATMDADRGDSAEVQVHDLAITTLASGGGAHIGWRSRLAAVIAVLAGSG